jgi:glycosyltransferase involved in cell wall biosynthesis
MMILAIMVVYNQDILSSTTFQSLMGALAKHDSEGALSLMVYDNSPASQNLECFTSPVSITYVHDPTNAGLAKAYNHALDVAVSDGFEWLLLLDQDSTLPEDFTVKLINTAEMIKADENLVAIVPRVKCLGETVSPSVVKFGGCFRPVDASIMGTSHPQVTSINSGTMLRTTFMKTVGGFNTVFRLDYLDHWVFSTIYSNSKSVYISESVVDHELSIMDYDRLMNLERYESILNAEVLFLDMCRPKYEKYTYMARLINRIKDQAIDRNKRKYLKTTWRALKRILFDDNNQQILH